MTLDQVEQELSKLESAAGMAMWSQSHFAIRKAFADSVRLDWLLTGTISFRVTVEAYMVVTDIPACERCGAGHTWTVCGPDGVNGSTSYSDQADADDEADILNAAYNAGRASGIADATPIQQCRRAEGHDGPCSGLPRKTCKIWPPDKGVEE